MQHLGEGLGDALRTFKQAVADVRNSVDPEMRTIQAEMDAAQKRFSNRSKRPAKMLPSRKTHRSRPDDATVGPALPVIILSLSILIPAPRNLAVSKTQTHLPSNAASLSYSPCCTMNILTSAGRRQNRWEKLAIDRRCLRSYCC
jgi:Sec-independent protein translocase protein TatA